MPDFPFDLSKLDMSSVMEMARKLKESMARIEEEMGKIEVESVVGGGMVKVKANARAEVISITIDPELLAMNDKDMLENLVCSGVNQALSEARRRREEQMQKMAGGLGLPGWFA